MALNGKGRLLYSSWLRTKYKARMRSLSGSLYYDTEFSNASQTDEVVWKDFLFPPAAHNPIKITQFRPHTITGRRYGSFAGRSGAAPVIRQLNLTGVGK